MRTVRAEFIMFFLAQSILNIIVWRCTCLEWPLSDWVGMKITKALYSNIQIYGGPHEWLSTATSWRRKGRRFRKRTGVHALGCCWRMPVAWRAHFVKVVPDDPHPFHCTSSCDRLADSCWKWREKMILTKVWEMDTGPREGLCVSLGFFLCVFVIRSFWNFAQPGQLQILQVKSVSSSPVFHCKLNACNCKTSSFSLSFWSFRYQYEEKIAVAMMRFFWLVFLPSILITLLSEWLW